MAVLGQPTRLMYEAKNHAQGLQGIHAFVSRPDGVEDGPFPMIEMSGNFFGSYVYLYETTLQSPPGDYFIRYISPQENVTQSAMRSLQQPSNTLNFTLAPELMPTAITIGSPDVIEVTLSQPDTVELTVAPDGSTTIVSVSPAPETSINVEPPPVIDINLT